MVPPWKQLLGPSLTKPDGNWTGVFTKKWSEGTKYSVLCFFQEKIPSSSGNGLCHTTPGEILLTWAILNDIHVGMTKLGLYIHLGIIMGGNWGSFAGCYLIIWSLISSCIQNVLMPTFQYHNKSSFFGPDNFGFSSMPTQGPQKFENFSKYPSSQSYVSVG